MKMIAENAQQVPEEPGIYEVWITTASGNNYVEPGETENLRARMKRRIQNPLYRCLVMEGAAFEFVVIASGPQWVEKKVRVKKEFALLTLRKSEGRKTLEGLPAAIIGLAFGGRKRRYGIGCIQFKHNDKIRFRHRFIDAKGVKHDVCLTEGCGQRRNPDFDISRPNGSREKHAVERTNKDGV